MRSLPSRSGRTEGPLRSRKNWTFGPTATRGTVISYPDRLLKFWERIKADNWITRMSTEEAKNLFFLLRLVRWLRGNLAVTGHVCSGALRKIWNLHSRLGDPGV